ncbi:alpha/beta fold hydrolase [Hyphococcus sp.]|uniref:alpha/beta fold hydrolase n=1 Tax=Hyphococcus sp. TaxID=2038636 RepID=UPI003CCC2F2A
MKKRYALPLLFVVALAGAFVFLQTLDTDPAAMEAKYTNEHSRFAEGPGGLRVHYRDEGNRNGVPIVLLHGNSASLHTWAPLVERLGGEYRLITLTLPGHGLTGPNGAHDYSADGMLAALNLVAAETGLQRFVLGGNSMGGWLSWRYALDHPDRVEALLLLDAAGMPLREGEEEPPLNLGFRLLAHPAGRFLMQRFTPRAAVEESMRQSVSVQSIVTEEAVDRYWELLRYPGNRKAAGQRFLTVREPQYAERIGEIAAPTLILWGAQDRLIYASAAQTFEERMQNTRVIVYEGVGHLPMEEAPDRTAADIDAFLDDVLVSQASGTL